MNNMRRFNVLFALALLCLMSVSCSVKEIMPGCKESLKCNFSAVLPDLEQGECPDTRASLESMVRISWDQGNRLIAVNLTTGKQLGGYLVADNGGSSTTFTAYELDGTVSAGDRLVFFLDYDKTLDVEAEKTFETVDLDFSSQRGDGNDVPIMVYAEYTATADNEINAENLTFKFLVSYMQLALAALPAGLEVSSMTVYDVSSKCHLTISESGEFTAEPENGDITLTRPFSANSKGANVRYFSMFKSDAQTVARNMMICVGGIEHNTAWLKSSFNTGMYYQSVATGFTNENIDFVDSAFKAYCVSNYDKNSDGELSFSEAAAITAYADFTSEQKASISSVYELAYFPAELGIPSFEGCTALKRIILPGTVSSIPAREFAGCSSIEEINIPDNVTAIGENAFYGCTSLKYFSGKFATSDNRFLKDGEALLAYAAASGQNVPIPDEIRTIADGVFEGCAGISSVQLGAITGIGKNAFAGCTRLASISLSENLESVGENAFSGCNGLSSVYCLNGTPAAIASGAFSDCSEDLKIFVSEESYEDYTKSDWNAYSIVPRIWNKIYYTTTNGEPVEFTGSDVTDGTTTGNVALSVTGNTYSDGQGVITFNGDIKNIGTLLYGKEDGGICDLTTVVTMTFPDSMESFPKFGDAGDNIVAPNLVSVNIPASLKAPYNRDHYLNFGGYMLSTCPKLSTLTGTHVTTDGKSVVLDGVLIASVPDGPEEITIPSDVTEIGNNAFIGCTNLRKVIIPASVKKFTGQCFRLCTINEYQLFSETPAEIEEYCFWFTENGTISVPASAVEDYKTAGDAWIAIKDRIVGY